MMALKAGRHGGVSIRFELDNQVLYGCQTVFQPVTLVQNQCVLTDVKNNKLLIDITM